MARWIQNEKEWADMQLKHLEDIYWLDKNNQYWFSDETEANACGPYDDLGECKRAAAEYAKTL